MNSFREAGESIHVHRSDENLKMTPLPSKSRPQMAKRRLLCMTDFEKHSEDEPTDIQRIRCNLGSKLYIWIVKSSEEHGVMHLYQVWPW